MITFDAYDTTFTTEPTFARYPNDRLAIRMIDSEDGSPVCTLTTNLPDQHLNPGEVFIKHWAENEPIFNALVEAGCLIDTGREVASGYTNPKAMLLAGPLLAAFDHWMW